MNMSNFTISTKNVFVYAKYNIIQMIDEQFLI